MNTAIRVEDLGKSYQLTHERTERYVTLRDELTNAARGLGQKITNTIALRRTRRPTTEIFWALRGINFEIQQGARVGIIGRNGAGKSTLLKILSRITSPTTGRVQLTGRLASLLEVGTGFHPELTGRENIFLNGAILGMSKAEIRRKFDDIVAFAEVEKFLDTPVKRYSSGMYVRLAFAISAHLEPDILIVDEVLAVGDISFQEKCLGRMSEISGSGRTVVFVSHNMNAIRQLCSSVLHISSGELLCHSNDVDAVIRDYLTKNAGRPTTAWDRAGQEHKNPFFWPKRFYVAFGDGMPIATPIRANQEAYVVIEAEVEQYNQNLTIGYALYTQEGTCLYWSYNTDAGGGPAARLAPGLHVLRSQIPPGLLNEGSYQLELIGGLHFTEWLFEPRRHVPAITIDIQGGAGDSSYWINKRPTLLAPVLQWHESAITQRSSA